jgi:hypothetical protein
VRAGTGILIWAAFTLLPDGGWAQDQDSLGECPIHQFRASCPDCNVICVSVNKQGAPTLVKGVAFRQVMLPNTPLLVHVAYWSDQVIVLSMSGTVGQFAPGIYQGGAPIKTQSAPGKKEGSVPASLIQRFAPRMPGAVT